MGMSEDLCENAFENSQIAHSEKNQEIMLEKRGVFLSGIGQPFFARYRGNPVSLLRPKA
jgi:hypothetical protein